MSGPLEAFNNSCFFNIFFVNCTIFRSRVIYVFIFKNELLSYIKQPLFNSFCY